MSPATCNADFMKRFLTKWDSEIPIGLRYDRYTSDGLDAFENWLKQKLEFVNSKRSDLERDGPFGVPF